VSFGRGHRLDHLDFESVPLPELAQHTNVARAVSSESMIVADQQLLEPESASQHPLDEFLGGKRR
jgi:hypothetical protein